MTTLLSHSEFLPEIVEAHLKTQEVCLNATVVGPVDFLGFYLCRNVRTGIDLRRYPLIER